MTQVNQAAVVGLGIALVVGSGLVSSVGLSRPIAGILKQGLSNEEILEIEPSARKTTSSYTDDPLNWTAKEERHEGIQSKSGVFQQFAAKEEITKDTKNSNFLDDPHDSMSKSKTAALAKGSSLRLDWTNLPPRSELGRYMEQVQSKCLSDEAPKTLQTVVAFPPRASGLGSTLHTWMRGLCHATEYGYALLTREGRFQWNDKEVCPSIFQQQEASLSVDRLQQNVSDNLPNRSAFWCYFGHHESALRCPAGTLNVTHIEPDKKKFIQYRCPKIMKQYRLGSMQKSAAEWLFQNVSSIIIQEAERQIRDEAFPSGIPPADSLITMHIRWGDKVQEMKLQPIDAYVNATLSLLRPSELAGDSPFHIYLATEDPTAYKELSAALNSTLPHRNFKLHTSGPNNPTTDFKMTNAAQISNGKAGLESMGALLVSLEANRYVMTGRSNWSRLINELRNTIIDSRCGNCTQMVDVTAD